MIFRTKLINISASFIYEKSALMIVVVYSFWPTNLPVVIDDFSKRRRYTWGVAIGWKNPFVWMLSRPQVNCV
tara:strand:+ start:1359 stop:1574 length:216 start_codon:yes stop_codon:yes gene_type:complete